MQNDFQYFIYLIFPAIILALGIFGNIFGLLVITRKRLEKIGPKLVQNFLFLFDFIYFYLILVSYFQYGFQIDPLLNRISCKIYWFLNYSLAIMSPLFAVYISVERFISLAYPSKKILINKKITQNVYIIIVISYNLVLYFPIAIYFDTFNLVLNETNNETVLTCNFITLDSQVVLSYIDLFNRVVIPSILMVIFTICNIYTIFKSRRKLATNKTL